jgi:hypothetical protein
MSALILYQKLFQETGLSESSWLPGLYGKPERLCQSSFWRKQISDIRAGEMQNAKLKMQKRRAGSAPFVFHFSFCIFNFALLKGET